MNIFSIFTPVVWFMVIFCGYFEAFILHLCMLFEESGKRPTDYTTTSLIMFSINMGISQMPYNPTKLIHKIYFLFMLFYGFLLVATFNSFLIKILTRPIIVDQVSTVDDIIQNRMEVVGDIEVKKLYGSSHSNKV